MVEACLRLPSFGKVDSAGILFHLMWMDMLSSGGSYFLCRVDITSSWEHLSLLSVVGGRRVEWLRAQSGTLHGVRWLRLA